eukprot:GEMP01002347.1.p1 GENE.GEMP01002347.1~~GEMP01002347.1.p1  ORF type:complete len:793 (+),score=137.86 GEMP01002347.1:253-2631(+)
MVSQVRRSLTTRVFDLLHIFNEDDHVTCLECAEAVMDIFLEMCPGCAVYIFAMTNYSRFDVPNTLFLTMQEPPDAELSAAHYEALTTPLQERMIIRWDTGEVFIPATCSREEYGVILLVQNPRPVPLSDNSLHLIAASLAQKWAFRLEFGRGRIMNEVSLELTEVMESVYGAVMKFVCAPPRATALADLWEGAETLIQRKIHEMAQELVPCDQIALWMVEGDELVIHNNDLRIRSHAVREFAGRVLIAGTPLSSCEPQEISQLGPYNTTLCIPIIVNGDVVAILQFIDKFNCIAPTRRYSDLVETVSRSQRDYRPPSRRSIESRREGSGSIGSGRAGRAGSFGKNSADSDRISQEGTRPLKFDTEEPDAPSKPRILSICPKPVARLSAEKKSTLPVEALTSGPSVKKKTKTPQTAVTLSRALGKTGGRAKSPSDVPLERKPLDVAPKRKLKASRTTADLSTREKGTCGSMNLDVRSLKTSFSMKQPQAYSLATSMTDGGSDREGESLFGTASTLLQEARPSGVKGIQRRRKTADKLQQGSASIISREMKPESRQSSRLQSVTSQMTEQSRPTTGKYPPKDFGSTGFTACDIEVGSILVSGPIFLALRAASLAAKLAREKRNAIAANSFNRAMSSALRLHDLTEMLCKQIGSILRAEHCAFFFTEESKQQLWSPPTKHRSFLTVDYDKTILGRCADGNFVYNEQSRGVRALGPKCRQTGAWRELHFQAHNVCVGGGYIDKEGHGSRSGAQQDPTNVQRANDDSTEKCWVFHFRWRVASGFVQGSGDSYAARII